MVADRRALAGFAAVIAACTPERASTVEEYEHSEQSHPGGARLVAWAGDEAVGAACARRIFVMPPEYDALWCDLAVLPQRRGRGIGTALHETARAIARDAGKAALHVPVLEQRPDAVAWLRRRGYEEFERSRTVGLELTDLPRPALDAPPGVEITTLAERPDLVPQVHDVAREALADIPGAGADYDAGTLEEFAAGLAHPSTRPEAVFLALEGDRCIGYAELALPGAQPGVAWHGMTGTRREARGRGVATALKRASIAWAIDAGLGLLMTENNLENAPMRSINAALGYRPRGDSLLMRGLVARPSADAP